MTIGRFLRSRLSSPEPNVAECRQIAKVQLVVTERFWQDKHSNHPAQKRLANAYLKHRDHTQVKPLLIEAARRWMGFVHIRGQLLEREPEDRNADQIASAMRERFGAPITPGEITFHGIPLTAIDDDGLLRLARFALLIISAGDRAPFVEAFVRWAVSRKLMGSALETDEVAWVLRLTDEDLWSLLKSRLIDMAVSTDETLRRAAYVLLTCLGIQEALRLKDTRLQGLYPPNEWQLAHQQDPCTSFFAWERHDCESCLQREDVPLHRLVSKLQQFVTEPSLTAPDGFIRRLTEAARNFSALEYRSHFGQTPSDVIVEEYTPSLARFAPTELANFMREAVRSLPRREEEGLRLLLLYLPEVALILHESELDVLKEKLTTLTAPQSAVADASQEGTVHAIGLS